MEKSLRQRSRELAEAEGVKVATALKRLQRQQTSQMCEGGEVPGWVDWKKAALNPSSRDRRAFEGATDFTDRGSVERWCEMLNLNEALTKAQGPSRIDGKFLLENGKEIYVVRREKE
jgi:hypothetical protein